MDKQKDKTAKKTSGKGKYLLQMTRKGVFLGICLVFLISAWMFVLGVLVGRGTAPVHFDTGALQEELKALKASILRQQQEKERVEIPTFKEKKDLDFYEALKGSKKDETLDLKKADAKKTDATPVAPKAETDAAPKKELVSMKKKTKGQVAAAPDGAYAVQVASLKDAAAAGEMVKKLNSRGFRAFNVSAEVPGKGTRYRVRVGGFSSSAEAEKARGDLARSGYKGMVVKN